ncbi:MAG TPA: FHA domain-containing protein [Vicinamibacterales bacterium]|nr:FHA domain-containing protein [Vicinamibacterales bacterium]
MRLAFADFTLDSETRQLARGGASVHLSPKAFDLLVILATQRPAVVDKDSLRDKLWPGTNVVDANLNNLASEIRTALGDDAQQPRFLRTVHRVGYAFCGVAAEQRDGAAAAPPARAFLVWQQRRFMLTPASQTIGRDPASAIWIDAPGVSRRHAKIALAGDHAAATIEDLGSTNGTFVDGRRISRATPLVDGQSIKIGEATLEFRTWSEAGAATKRIRGPRARSTSR